MRIRTIAKCMEELKAQDPGTCITTWAIRQAICDGSLNFKRSGNKYLVAIEDVEKRFGCSKEKGKEDL